MTTRRKLNLINGTIDTEGGIHTYRMTDSFKIGSCEPGWAICSSPALSR